MIVKSPSQKGNYDLKNILILNDINSNKNNNNIKLTMNQLNLNDINTMNYLINILKIKIIHQK